MRNLTDLSLFDNVITKIEGLDNLPELKVLSFGKNKITDLDHTITYLKSLKNKLQVLKMSDNPYIYGSNQNDQDYRLQAIFRLNKLKYLDYELIDEATRDMAGKKYSDQFNESESAADKKEDEDKTVDPELVDAKIDCTHRILDRLLENDPENSMKLKIL